MPDSGRMDLGMVAASNGGQMALCMRVIGEIIWRMERED